MTFDDVKRLERRVLSAFQLSHHHFTPPTTTSPHPPPHFSLPNTITIVFFILDSSRMLVSTSLAVAWSATVALCRVVGRVDDDLPLPVWRPLVLTSRDRRQLPLSTSRSPVQNIDSSSFLRDRVFVSRL